MMLLSLALIRHSVLSLSDGLPKTKPCKPHEPSRFGVYGNFFNLRVTDLSTNMEGESGRVVSRSFIVFHSLMQLWSEAMQLS